MNSSSELNRSFWNRQSDDYQERHREFIGRPEPRWGMWQIPEAELQVLGDVSGKDVLELGCGAAQWAILLARQGARTVGLDNSERQLEHARERMGAAGVDFPLVHAPAESIPLPDASFDAVFCDHGGLSFADPLVVVPEVARVLRPAGLLAFSHTTPFAWSAGTTGPTESRTGSSSTTSACTVRTSPTGRSASTSRTASGSACFVGTASRSRR
jgi:SAM-dependent methyltransferase